MTIYNHAFTIAFSVVSPIAAGDRIPARTLRVALLRRLAELDDDELIEAVGMPFDSYAEDDAYT